MRAAVLLVQLLLLLFSTLTGAYDVYGSGGAGTTQLWQKWSTDHAYTSAPVAVFYTPSTTAEALELFAEGQVDFVAVDDVLPPDVLRSFSSTGYLVQLPVVGNVVVIAYNLPDANATLILNGTVLADIWLGRVASWDHPALVELNPGMNLPHANITTVYGANSSYDESSAFARSLAAFLPDFAGSFAGGLSSLPPVAEGRSIGFSSPQQRLDHVTASEYTLTYAHMGIVQAASSPVPIARMRNRSGRLLTASTAGALSAMSDALPLVEAGNLTADIFDGPGEESWPLAYLSFLPFFVNRTASACLPVQQFASLLQWGLSNLKAAEDAADAGYASLPSAYVRRVLGALNEFTCNGDPVFSLVSLFGVGPPYPLYSRWAYTYVPSSGAGEVEYAATAATTNGTNSSAADAAALAELRNGNIDFALLVGGAIESGLAARADEAPVAVLPVIGFPYVPAYNVPGLAATLAFDLPTIADIYLRRIQMWNDTRLGQLNSGVQLPAAPIRVVYPPSGDHALETGALYQLLCQAVPLFNASVLDASAMYALVADLNSSVATSDVGEQVASVDYAFAMWPTVDLSPQASTGSIYRDKPDGTRVLVSLEIDALLTTLLDFAADLGASPGGPNATTNFVSTLVLGPDPTGWPLMGVGAIAFPTRTSQFCASAQMLSDFLWWTQTNNGAFTDALLNGGLVTGVVPQVRRAILQTLVSATCQGRPVSPLSRCIQGGVLCSNAGTCTSSGCSCRSGYSGTYCEAQSSGGDSSDTGRILGIVWGTASGILLVLLLLAAILLAATVYKVRQQRRAADQGLIAAALNEEPTPDVALESIRIEGIAPVQAQQWRG